MLSWIVKIITVWFTLVVGYYIDVALGVTALVVDMGYCEKNPVAGHCLEQTQKFINANHLKDSEAANQEYKREMLKAKGEYSVELKALIDNTTKVKADNLRQATSRSPTSDLEYTNAQGLVQGKFMTDKAELERRYQEEVLAPIQMAYEQKQQNIANQYGKDTLTVYNSLKGNK